MTGAAKPGGAYRPPGARGQLASEAYKRTDDEHSSGTSTPTATPMFRGGKPSQRYIPGSNVPGAAAPAAAPEDKDKKKRARGKKKGDAAAAEAEVEPAAPVAEMGKVDIKDEKAGGEGEDEANAKRVRNLVKKVSCTSRDVLGVMGACARSGCAMDRDVIG